MSSNVFLPEYVERYVVSEITRETDAQKQLREKTKRMPEHGMQISPVLDLARPGGPGGWWEPPRAARDRGKVITALMVAVALGG